MPPSKLSNKVKIRNRTFLLHSSPGTSLVRRKLFTKKGFLDNRPEPFKKSPRKSSSPRKWVTALQNSNQEPNNLPTVGSSHSFSSPIEQSNSTLHTPNCQPQGAASLNQPKDTPLVPPSDCVSSPNEQSNSTLHTPNCQPQSAASLNQPEDTPLVPPSDSVSSPKEQSNSTLHTPNCQPLSAVSSNRPNETPPVRPSHSISSPDEQSNSTLHTPNCEPLGAVSSVQHLNKTPVNLDAEYIPTLPSDFVRKILLKTPEGQSALKVHEKIGRLPSYQKPIITQLLVSHELQDDPGKTISKGRFIAMAKAITECFPKEVEETYYVASEVDVFGKWHRASGRLYDRVVNMKRKFRKDGLLPATKSCRRRIVDLSDDEGDNDDALLKEKLRFLENNSKDTEGQSIIEAFKVTRRLRIKLFRTVGEQDISTYIKCYPCLKQEDGFILIETDFAAEFSPRYCNTLINVFDENLARKIIALAEEKCEDSKDFATLVKKEKINIFAAGKDQIIEALKLLPLLLPTVPINKNTWKPSVLESARAFCLEVSSANDLSAQLDARYAKLIANRIKVLPTCVIVGPKEEAEYFVYFTHSLKWKCESILKAIDVSFKLLLTLKVDLPVDCLLPWIFLKKHIYCLKGPERQYPSISALAHSLDL